MKIEISGNKCVSCSKYTQYYRMNGNMVEAIDCGYCGKKQRTTRPGNRCREYRERGNAGAFAIQ